MVISVYFLKYFIKINKSLLLKNTFGIVQIDWKIIHEKILYFKIKYIDD